MTIYLRQSTASQEIALGYFVDSTDGNTEETGLTIANTDIKLWKTGATTLANKNSGGATHISNGIYYAVLDATDTDTLGPLVIFVHVSGALTVRLECCVLDELVYDSLIAASDNLQVDTIQAAGTAWGSGALTAAALAADAVTEIQSGLALAADLSTDAEIADAVLDEVFEGSTTLRQALRVIYAVLAGKSSGGGTTSITFRDLADSKARVTATVDSSGNRTAMTLDAS